MAPTRYYLLTQQTSHRAMQGLRSCHQSRRQVWMNTISVSYQISLVTPFKIAWTTPPGGAQPPSPVYFFFLSRRLRFFSVCADADGTAALAALKAFLILSTFASLRATSWGARALSSSIILSSVTSHTQLIPYLLAHRKRSLKKMTISHKDSLNKPTCDARDTISMLNTNK